MGNFVGWFKQGVLTLICTALLFTTYCFFDSEPQTANASHKPNNTIGLTPPMGYSTWNAVRFNISDQLIRDVADSMVSTGLLELGYEYINIDDGWQGGRDANGNIYADKTKFPQGMKALADYVHSKGLKIGIYTDLGRIGCGGNIGSYGYYQQDVNLFAEWGYDYIKVDACGADSMGLDFKTYYEQFSNALKNASPKRDILFNICEWGKQQPWNWAPEIGNTWRVGYDIDNQGDYWKGVLYEIDKVVPHADVAGPGHFNDPDSLEVGVIADKYPGQLSLNYEESVSNFSMWSVLASPLILGLDVTTLNEPTSYSSKFADIIKNAEVIAVNQDPAGIQGELVDESIPDLQVYSKPLGSKDSGERAVVLFNRSNAPAKMTVTSDMIGLEDKFTVRDLWKKKNMGTRLSNYSATIPAHGSVMLKISGVYNQNPTEPSPPVVYEAEAGTLTGKANFRSIAEASGGRVVGNVGDGAENALQFSNISVHENGVYRLNIYYVSGDANRDAELTVNGNLSSKLSFPSSGGWSSVRARNVNIELNKGINTLKLSNQDKNAYAPDFDKIELSTIPILPPEETKEVKTYLTGPDKVTEGDKFEIELGISNTIGHSYAQDIMVKYDTTTMAFQSARSLIDGIQLIEVQEKTPGLVRLIMASAGEDHAVTGDAQMVELSFTAASVKDVESGVIFVENATLGDENGDEVEGAVSSKLIEVTAKGAEPTVDVNGDGKVSIGDLGIVAAHYGKNTTSPDWQNAKRADINNDGKIDIVDLAAVAKRITE